MALPSSPTNTHPASPSATWTRDLLWLCALFGLLYFSFLGHWPLDNPDEGRYAEIPREMIQSGDWVLPHLNGVVYFEKPPLVYWCTALSMMAFGQTEWAVRLIPALFGFGGILLTYASTRRLYGRNAGLIAAGTLGSCLIFFALSRILILDMVVSVFMAATLFCFILGIREEPGFKRRLFFYGLYASSALATLSKGLIGFMVTGAVMFFWLLLLNQWKRLRPLYLPSGAALFLLIAAPWHILAAQRHPEWAQFYFINEHWARFTTNTHERTQPFWFFAPILLAGFMPWTGFLWTAAREKCRGAWSRRKEDADTWFLIIWIGFIFLFFSKSQSKLIPYLLPVFPALAALTGAWLSEVLHAGQSKRLRTGLWSAVAFLSVLCLAAFALAIKPTLLKDSASALASRPQLIILGQVLITCLVTSIVLFARNKTRLALLALGAAPLAMLLVAIFAFPNFQRRSTRDMAEVFNQKARPGDVLYHYRGFHHDFCFYSKALTGTVEHIGELEVHLDKKAQDSGRFIKEDEFLKQWNGPTRVWALARDSEAAKLFNKPGLKYHKISSSRFYFLLSNQP